MEWAFRYIGPLKSEDVRDCPTCSTVARGRCVEHAQALVGCPHCDAVRDKLCASHCGLAVALEHHDPSANDPANYKWVTTAVTPGERGGRTQQRVDLPMNDAKQERIDKAKAQFGRAAAAILAQAELWPERCQVDVFARGDDNVGRLAAIEIQIHAVE